MADAVVKDTVAHIINTTPVQRNHGMCSQGKQRTAAYSRRNVSVYVPAVTLTHEASSLPRKSTESDFSLCKAMHNLVRAYPQKLWQHGLNAVPCGRSAMVMPCCMKRVQPVLHESLSNKTPPRPTDGTSLPDGTGASAG